MLEYLLENENQIIVTENGEKLAKLNYEVREDGIVVLDAYELSSSFVGMEYYFNFFRTVTKSLKSVLQSKGIDAKKVVLKDFKSIKDLDNYVLDELEVRGKTKTGMR